MATPPAFEAHLWQTLSVALLLLTGTCSPRSVSTAVCSSLCDSCFKLFPERFQVGLVPTRRKRLHCNFTLAAGFLPTIFGCVTWRRSSRCFVSA